MMSKEERRASWWQVYLLVLGFIGLLGLGAVVPMSERGHQAAGIGMVLLACGTVEVWLRANRRALLHIDGLTLVEQPGPGVVVDVVAEEPQPPVGRRQPPVEGEDRITAIPPAYQVDRKEMMAQ